MNSLFRLCDRIWTVTGHSGNGLGRLAEFTEGWACEVLYEEVIDAALSPEAGWERIAELYEGGIRTPERMIPALSVPAPFALGAL